MMAKEQLKVEAIMAHSPYGAFPRGFFRNGPQAGKLGYLPSCTAYVTAVAICTAMGRIGAFAIRIKEKLDDARSATLAGYASHPYYGQAWWAGPTLADTIARSRSMVFSNVKIPEQEIKVIEHLFGPGAKVKHEIIMKIIDKHIYKHNVTEAMAQRFIKWNRLHERWLPSTLLWISDTFPKVRRLPATIIASWCRYLSNGWPTTARFGEAHRNMYGVRAKEAR